MALQGSGLVISSDTGRTLTLGSSPATARAGRAVIVGVVIDPAMGEYMRNVSVQIVDAAGVKRTTTSGEGGVFRLTDVAGGFAQVTASFAGYPDQISEIELAGGYTAHRHGKGEWGGCAGQRRRRWRSTPSYLSAAWASCDMCWCAPSE